MSGSGSSTRSRPLRQRNIFRGRERFGPNMTPMVDVVLVILIFFMAASTIVGQEWFLRAELPERVDGAASESGFDLPEAMLDLELFVRGGGVMVRGMGEGALTLDEVVGRIEGMDPALSDGLILRIGARDEVPYGALVALHDAASGRGMRVAIR